MPRVIEGDGLVQTRYPVRPRTGRPFSSTTSVAIPGAGPPKLHGLSAWMGNGNRKQPTISVPPEMLMMGQRRRPTRSKNHIHEDSSQGSPVEPSRRSDSIGGSSPADLLSTRIAVGETPNVVRRWRSITSHRRIGAG